jgi:hypothetical protein
MVPVFNPSLLSGGKMTSENQKERLERGLLEVVDFYRGLILDMVE